MGVDRTVDGGPYRENQKPKDTWRIEVRIKMKSGEVHEYSRSGQDENTKNFFLVNHPNDLFGRGQSNERPRERIFLKDDSMFNIGFDPTILWIKCDEIESLKIDTINEREENERIVESLREQRRKAADRLANE